MLKRIQFIIEKNPIYYYNNRIIKNLLPFIYKIYKFLNFKQLIIKQINYKATK